MDGISPDRQAFDSVERDAARGEGPAERDEAAARSASPDPVPAPLDRAPANPTSP